VSTWLWLGPYCAVAVIAWRLVAGHLAWWWFERNTWSYKRDHTSPDSERWIAAGVMGLFAALIWPVLLLWRLLPRTNIGIGAEARAKARQQAERIRELEKEAGLR
jgi:hypothetical protein